MANKLALHTLGGIHFIQLDGDPSISGYNAPVGSMAFAVVGGVGKQFIKSGSALDTDWINVSGAGADVSAEVTRATNAELALGVRIDDEIQDRIDADVVLQGNIDLKINLSEKGSANGVAQLGADGKVPFAQIPAIAIVDTFVVASEAAMLALSGAEQGDVAVRTDLNKSFILVSGLYSTLANWQELLTPTDTILSVNGQTGIVSLDSDDIAEGVANLYFTDARAVSALGSALALKADVTYVDADGGYYSQASSATPLVLTNATKKIRITSNATQAQTIKMPSTASLQVGENWYVNNFSGQIITINDFNDTLITTIPHGYRVSLVVTSTASEASWSAGMVPLRYGSTGAPGLNMASRQIENVTDPSAPQHASTKNYVDTNFSLKSETWKFVNSPTLMNDALAQMYFGTKSGDFDILFYRNNVQAMKFASNAVHMSADLTFDTDASEILGSNLSVISTTSLTLNSAMLIDNFSGLRIVRKNASDSISLSASHTIGVPVAEDGGKNRKMKVTVMMKSDAVAPMYVAFERTLHINEANVIVIEQADFTSRNAEASLVDLTLSVGITPAFGISAVLSGLDDSGPTHDIQIYVEDVIQS